MPKIPTVYSPELSQQLAQRLEGMIRQPKGMQMREIIQENRGWMYQALEAGYSYEDIVAAMAELKLPIKSSTLKQYLRETSETETATKNKSNEVASGVKGKAKPPSKRSTKNRPEKPVEADAEECLSLGTENSVAACDGSETVDTDSLPMATKQERQELTAPLVNPLDAIESNDLSIDSSGDGKDIVQPLLQPLEETLLVETFSKSESKKFVDVPELAKPDVNKSPAPVTDEREVSSEMSPQSDLTSVAESSIKPSDRKTSAAKRSQQEMRSEI